MELSPAMNEGEFSFLQYCKGEGIEAFSGKQDISSFAFATCSERNTIRYASDTR